MPERYKRYFLKAKECKTFLEEASQRLNVDLELLLKDKLNIEAFQTESTEIFLANRKPLFTKIHGNIYPTLRFNEYVQLAPKVVVDMGAVPYVCKGANIMAPGIRRFMGEFKKDSIVFVVDEKHGKPLAVGEILYDSEQAKDVKQGIVVKNVHFVGDGTWNMMKELASSP